jgi:uncharacterized damage-inducible protein DinB
MWIREISLNIAKHFGIDTLNRLPNFPWEEVIKSRGASFDSLRNILLHTIDAEDRLVNYVIPGRTKDRVSRNPDDFRDIDSIGKRLKEVESKTKAYVTRIGAAELESKVELPRPGTPSVLVRVEDVLVAAALRTYTILGN